MRIERLLTVPPAAHSRDAETVSPRRAAVEAATGSFADFAAAFGASQ